MSKFLSLVFLMTAFSSFAIEKVSFVSLLSSPERYDDLCVQTVGVISVEFEGGSLYLDRASYEAKAYENGISQPFEAAVIAHGSENSEARIASLTAAFEGKLVRVVGKFKAKNSLKPSDSYKSRFSTIDYIRTLASDEDASFGGTATCL